MNLTIAGIGAALLVIFAVFHFLRIFPTIRAVCAFAGVCLVAAAAAGAVGFDFVIVVVTWVENLLSDLTQWLLGVRIGALVLVIPLIAIFLHDLHPKNKAGQRTGWAGVALALVLIAGVAQIPVLSRIPGDLRTGVTNARTSIQSGQGG